MAEGTTFWKRIWRGYITSGLSVPEDRHTASRLKFINIFSLAGILLESSFGLANVASGFFITASAELLTVLALILNVAALRWYGKIDLAARVLIIAVAAPLMVMIFTTGGYNTGLLWLPAFPVAAYLLLGKREGSTTLLVLFLVIGFLALLESFELVQLAYSTLSIRQSIISLLVLSIILYVHENLREQSSRLADMKTAAVSDAYKEVRQSEQLRDEFTSALAHELRDAFAASQKLTEYWRDQGDKMSPERAKEYVRLMHRSSTDGLAMVNSLLDVMSVDTADFKVAPSYASLRQVIDQQLALFEPQARKAHVALLQVIDEEVPLQLYIDSFRIKQVVSNLLSNALKHTAPNGTITVHVIQASDFEHLKSKAQDLGITWYVSDKDKKLSALSDFVFLGVSHEEKGISRDDIGKLFKKFSRLQPRDELHPPTGRGLGLYIIRRIIESHKGSYGVASKVNEGVTFYVTLPNRDVSHNEDTT